MSIMAELKKKGSHISGDCGSDPTIYPEWMDRERFKRGQQFFIRNMACAAFALHCAVTVGFGAARIVEPLVFTKNSDTGPKAMLRYMKTFIHVALWHLQDVWDPNTLGHKSVQTVRRIHNKVRGDIEEAKKNDANKKPRYVSQYDMALVQSGFVGVFVAYPEQFGIKCTREEVGDYLFFWRGIGYLLGMQDEFNVCGMGYEKVYRFAKEIERELVYPGLIDPEPHVKSMADAYVAGANIAAKSRAFTRDSIMQFSLDMTDYKLPWLECTWIDHLHIWVYKFYTFMLRWAPGFAAIFNWLHMEQFRKNMYLIDKELAKFL